MKKDLTELVFVLDKSGSMHGLEQDTIGGFNSMLEKQRALPGECRVTTALFSHDYTLLHDRIDIRAVAGLTGYVTGGSTALLDAVGRTVEKIVSVQRSTAEPYRAEKVVFVIITDGMENSSTHYSLPAVKAMIERQQKEFGWEFIFLGANIDAVETAGQFGIAPDRAAEFICDSQGTELNFRAVSEAVGTLRSTGVFPAAPLQAIREDKKKRGWGRR